MAKYLDLGGLTTVVDNVKSLVDVLHITSIQDTWSTTYIRNSKTSTYSALVYVKSLNTVVAKNGSYAYTQWTAKGKFKSYEEYGTSTQTGVTLRNSTLVYCTSEKSLYFYHGSLNTIGSSVEWTNIWKNTSSTDICKATPFIDDSGNITSVDRRLNENDNYVFKITIKNTTSKGHEYRMSCGGGAVVRYLIYLSSGQSGICTVELPKNQGNWYFTVSAA